MYPGDSLFVTRRPFGSSAQTRGLKKNPATSKYDRAIALELLPIATSIGLGYHNPRWKPEQ
jgi:hypothetical protein